MGSLQNLFSRRGFFWRGASVALGLMTLGKLIAPPQVFAAELRTVTMSTTATAAGLLSEIIEAQKLDRKHGLVIKASAFDPAAAEQATILKKVDTGLMVPLSAARATLEGIPTLLLAPQLASHVSMVVRTDAPYRSITELKGKKIGSLAKVTGAYGGWMMIFKNLGMDYEKDLQLVIGAPPVIVAWLQKGEVEATTTFEPFTSRLVATGQYRILLDQNEWWRQNRGVPMPFAYVGAAKEWVEKNKSVVKAIQETYREATQYVGRTPKELRGIYKSLFKVDDEKVLDLLEKRMPEFYKLTWDAKTVNDGKAFLKEAVELGILKEEPKEDIFVPPL